MNTGQALDPALLDRVSRQCAQLARDFDRFGADLYALSVSTGAAPVPPASTSVRPASTPARLASTPAGSASVEAHGLVPPASTPAGSATTQVPVPAAPGIPPPSLAPAAPSTVPADAAPAVQPTRPAPELGPAPAPFPGRAAEAVLPGVGVQVPPAAPAGAPPAGAQVPSVPPVPPTAVPSGGVPGSAPVGRRFWSSPSLSGGPTKEAGTDGTATAPPAPPALPFGAGPTPDREPWWQRDGWVSRVLALSGVAVTLAGIVMLLVLAARAGLLRPETRVAGGVLLAGAFVLAGHRVIGRPGGRVGGVALAATGVVTAYLDVLAVTVLYDWVSAPVGLAFAFVLTALGGALAMSWRSPHLALIVNVACALAAPLLTGGLTLTLVLFFLAVQVAGAVPELMRGWSVLAATRTPPVVIALVGLVARESSASLTGRSVQPGAGVIAIAVAVAVVGLGVGLWGAPVQTRPDVAALSSGVATVPLLYAVTRSERPVAVLLSLGLAAGCLGALVVLRRRPAPIRIVVASVGGMALLLACVAVVPDDGTMRPVPLLAVAVIASALALRTTSRSVQAYAAAFGLLGLVTTLGSVQLSALFSEPVAERILGPGALVTGVLLLATTVLGALAARRSPLPETHGKLVLIATVAVGLYAATIVCVSLPMAIGGGEGGFRAGHFVATTVWMLIGCGLLALGLARPAVARVCLATGLTVVGAALVKLIGYDMATLDGFTRAATFLVTGILLLVAGTRYARALADQDGPPSTT